MFSGCCFASWQLNGCGFVKGGVAKFSLVQFSTPLLEALDPPLLCTITSGIILCACSCDIPYSGKFSYGANFCIFRMFQAIYIYPLYENKN